MVWVCDGESVKGMTMPERFDASARSLLPQRRQRDARRVGTSFGSTEVPPGLGLPLSPVAVPHLSVVLASITGRDARMDAPSDSAGKALLALERWDAFARASDDEERAAFLAAARWLLVHEVRVAADAAGWPVAVPNPAYFAWVPWQSAALHGAITSILLRASLIGESADSDTFRACARRALRTFTLDILDGGLAAPIGAMGITFQGVAVYPAAYVLADYLVALNTLHDYVNITGDSEATACAGRAHASLHALLLQYDTGIWTREDLLRERLASRARHELHTVLLAALGANADCAECRAAATRWHSYTVSWKTRIWRPFASSPSRAVARGSASSSRPLRVCVPITAYPVAGGMRAVLSGWREALQGEWTMEFLTRHIGSLTREDDKIASFETRLRVFGKETTSPAQFPNVWLYWLAGYRRLNAMLRRDRGYDLVLPQDGVFTSAFAAIVGRRRGRRVVTVDHGNVTDIYNYTFYADKIALLRHQRPLKRLISRLRLILYWPSQRLMLRIATRNSNFFLTASDDITDIYRQRLGVPAHRVACFPFMIDASRYVPLAGDMRDDARRTRGVPADAIVITLANRLHPTKGMDVAIPALGAMMSALPPDVRGRVRILIAGDGPLRRQVEADVTAHGLDGVCHLLGEASADEIVTLLGMSDIFLFAARRSINSMAVLEAMAAGCAVVGSVSTRHIGDYLENGRGIAVPVGDSAAMAAALTDLVRDTSRRRETGAHARHYVAEHHTAAVVRRVLLRAAYWAPNLPSTPVR